MYAAYFGLKHEPFSIAPDPRYLFMSERHREALAHLLYGLGTGGGFVLLTGEIGTGKTTLCRLFLDQIPENCNVAYIFNPKLTVLELLESVCGEFHVRMPRVAADNRTVKDYLDPLNAFLLESHAAGRNNVLVIDEAQNLAPEVLEQLRLLTNLETSERKLLQIILIGQPELRDMLARPDLEQLAQRVIARFHLGPLTSTETAHYVQHRLEVAGLERPLPFDARALRRVHELSRGVPRRINLLCDRALLGAFAQSKERVDLATVDQAASEVFGTEPRAPFPLAKAAALFTLGLATAVAAYAAFAWWSRDASRATLAARPPASQAVAAASAASAVSAASAPSAPLVAGEWPATLNIDVNDAWRDLAALWKVDAGEAAVACASLARRQLQCFSRPMTLALIRELGRPGIVTLDGGGGRREYAVLTGLSPTTATLQAGGKDHVVALEAFASRWHGDFATLWRSPEGYDTRTPSVTASWLADRLAESGLPAGPASSPLRSQLRAFQLAHGLPGDGQAGPLTFMQLNRATGVPEPRLRVQP